MKIFNQRSVWWVLANMLGIGVFLAFASKSWIEPALADVPGASVGNFMVWGTSALPILVSFFFVHLIVGLIALKRMQRDWALALMLTTGCWIAAAVFDNAHHGI